ncbi:MAG: DNA polymerase IV [Gammaproteobacteria bacterium]
MTDGFQPGSRCVLHVDMDAFYASVEQQDDPGLAGRPVLVGGTGGRGVVAAASYEARRYGCRSAMPMSEALKRCPGAVCLRPRMDRYREVSGRVFAVLQDYTPLVEGLSLDEAYLDVTDGHRLHADPRRLAADIKHRIRTDTGLTASVGAGPNKLVAKIASDLDKPDGLVVLFGGAVTAALDPLPVSAIGGIGPRTARRLADCGIRHIADLREAPEGLLTRVFGRHAGRMREKASGRDDRPVVPEREEISVSAEKTFERDLHSRSEMEAELSRLAERVSARLRRKSLAASRIVLKIRRADFATFTRQKRVSPPVNSDRLIAANARELLSAWMADQPGARIRLLGVGTGGLAPAGQMNLFETEEVRSGAAGTAADQVRARFGDGALVRARDLE